MRTALDPVALVDQATGRTALHDFGGLPWREGFERLVGALEHEAELNEAGRVLFSRRLVGALQWRLRVIDWRRHHPEIGDQGITRPVIIVGLPRTGTTALSNLLLQDPATRSLRYWEVAAPTPPPEAATYHTDPRIQERQRKIDAMHELVPELKRLHTATATSTAETGELLMLSFASFHFIALADVPSYERWWLQQDMVGAYRFTREILQLLQWRCPPTRWHLKNPADVFCLEAVRAVFPDAVFIWTHRDPAKVLPSTCSLSALNRGMVSDRVDRVRLGAEQVELWGEGIDRALAYRQALGDGIFLDVHMRDLAADPIGTVARIYAWLGWPFTADAEAAMAKWAAAGRDGGHGRDEPDPEAFELRPEAVRERFAAYIQRFGLVEGKGAVA
jgi:hypothetical protein